MGWLDRLKGRGADPGLAELIGAYPPYAPPFPRPHGKLKPDEAQANFAHLMEVKPDRLAVLDDLLRRFGLGTGEALGRGDPAPFLDRLHAWTADQWPSLQTAQAVREASWTYDGPARGATLSMVTWACCSGRWSSAAAQTSPGGSISIRQTVPWPASAAPA